MLTGTKRLGEVSWDGEGGATGGATGGKGDVLVDVEVEVEGRRGCFW